MYKNPRVKSDNDLISVSLNTAFGHRHYLYSAALLLFMRRTTIPNSSFLIPHSRKAFIHNQWTEPPKGLTLNQMKAK